MLDWWDSSLISRKQPKIGLGFMRHDLRKNNQNIVDYAMANGINYFETCYFYLDHQCEDYVYSLLQKYNRESYEICGKMSLNEAFLPGMTYQEMFQKQLDKVPGHYFDIYILQTLRPEAYSQVFNSDLIEFMLQEKAKGHIGRFGFSEQCDSQLLSKFLQLNCWDIAQMALNYYDWYLCEKDKNYKMIAAQGIPIIAQAPYKGGYLVKDLTPQMENLIIEAYGRTPAETAIDFVVSKEPEVILAGCSQLETVMKYEKAIRSAKPLPQEETLKQVMELYKEKVQFPCLLCGKCEYYCPQHIHLPLHINFHNRTLANPEYFNSLCQLKYFSPDPVNQCIRCGQCINVCPLHTDIPGRLEDLFNLRP